MPYETGWAAINLEMPERVPRTEYSAERHWDLVKVVTGIEVDTDSPPDKQQEASNAFRKAWNYDFGFGVMINRREFGDVRTDMGHAVYAKDGVDRRDAGEAYFKSVDDVLAFDPRETFGRKDRKELIERFEKDYRMRLDMHPWEVATTGTYTTLVSGFIDLFGWDMLLSAAGADPDGFGELANRYAEWLQQYFDAMAESDIPILLVHDDMVISNGPIFNPVWYRQYVFPNFKKYIDPLLQAGKKVAFCSDGDFSLFIDDLADCGFHGFIMEPMTDMAYIAEKYGKTHFFIGNADTRILLSGSKEKIRAEVERCMNLGKDCPGFFMAVGNHIPPNTPVENCLYYNEVYEELSRR